MKQLLGVFLIDLPRYIPAILKNDDSYLSLCNRAERLVPAPDASGYRCDWQWTSDLYAVKFLPLLGRLLMKRALSYHPIRRLREPEYDWKRPQVSFIIGHRGNNRLPHLMATLESIAGQHGTACECLVVEQDTDSLLSGGLPPWVRHIHTPPPVAGLSYCRSWAFNIGAKHAHGSILVLHDNDMLVPADYAEQIQRRAMQGFEVINLKRFIFFLREAHTKGLLFKNAALLDDVPEVIMQNAEGGGSVAITRDAFERIGGMDETFIGWGGEDNEFWERAQCCTVWSYGCLPFVHLWHPPQSGKHQVSNPALQRYRLISTIPPAQRVKQLRNRNQGQLTGPCSDSVMPWNS